MLVDTRSSGTVSKNGDNSGFKEATMAAYMDSF